MEIEAWKITNVSSVKNAVSAPENKIMKYFSITVYLFTRDVLKIKINIGSNRMLHIL